MNSSAGSPGPERGRPGHLRRALLRALLRAGAFGAEHGGQSGSPQLGLTVPVRDGQALSRTLEVLSGAGAQATLLVSTGLAAAVPEQIRAAVRAGHEIAGRGSVATLAALDVAAGGSAQHWEADGGAPGWAALRRLAARGLRPLPLPRTEARPGQTLRVAPEELGAVLGDLRARGYRPLPVRDLPGLRRATPRDLLLHLYEATVEANFTRAHHVIDLTGRPDGVMRVAPIASAPTPLPLAPGTPTAELHLDSARIVGLAERGVLGAYRAYQRSLKDVGRALRERPELHGAQAVFAVTLFYGPLEQSGFRLIDLPPARARLYGLGFRVLRLVHGTAGPSSAQRPRMAWMPRDEFLARYGERPGAAPPQSPRCP